LSFRISPSTSIASDSNLDANSACGVFDFLPDEGNNLYTPKKPETRIRGKPDPTPIVIWPTEEWLRKQSKDLLDIIEILYKGREAELKAMEEAQAKLESEEQIEHRINLIKKMLLEKESKAGPAESPGAPVQ